MLVEDTGAGGGGSGAAETSLLVCSVSMEVLSGMLLSSNNIMEDEEEVFDLDDLMEDDFRIRFRPYLFSVVIGLLLFDVPDSAFVASDIILASSTMDLSSMLVG